jgi:hypothetical protein
VAIKRLLTMMVLALYDVAGATGAATFGVLYVGHTPTIAAASTRT